LCQREAGRVWVPTLKLLSSLKVLKKRTCGPDHPDHIGLDREAAGSNADPFRPFLFVLRNVREIGGKERN